MQTTTPKRRYVFATGCFLSATVLIMFFQNCGQGFLGENGLSSGLINSSSSLPLTSDPTSSTTNAVGDWVPPIGIPMPSFGILENHLMYKLQDGETCSTSPQKCYDFGSGLEPYRDAGNGPYTHYIDPSNPAATDSANIFGTPEKPRKTLPTTLIAGMVIEAHPGTYSLTTPSIFKGDGTAQKPIFIRGEGHPFIPSIVFSRANNQSYIILENLALGGLTVAAPSHHIVVRHTELPGPNGIAIASYDSGKYVHDIVVYDVEVHRSEGTWDIPGPDVDHGGLKIDAGGVDQSAYNIWIVDGKYYHNAGGGVNMSNYGTPNSNIHHIYIGRNHIYETRQSGIGIKCSSNIVVSQNTIHDLKTSTLQSGNWGAGVVGQYGPENVWILFNKIYNAEAGVKLASDSANSPNAGYFIIGNEMYNLFPKTTPTAESAYNPAGIMSWGGVKNYIVNNTIANSYGGINTMNKSIKAVVNNLVVNTKSSPLWIDTNTAGASAVTDLDIEGNIFYGSAGTASFHIGTKLLNLSQYISAYPGKCDSCLEGDPMLLDLAKGDLNLSPGSIAIDAGSKDLPETLAAQFESAFGTSIKTDMMNIPRPQGSAWDVGAHESPSAR